MTEGIAVGQGAMHEGVVAVAEARDGLDDVVSAAMKEAEATAKSWTGSSGSAARGVVDAWREEMAAITKQLDALRVQLMETEKDQVATEEGQKETIGGLAKMMGAF